MSGLFGGGQPQAASTPKLTGIRIQSSVYGICIPILYGRNRLPGNLVWYGDFTATAQKSNMGGKGGGGGSTSGYVYSASLALGMCEGPVAGFGKVWIAKEQKDISDTNFSVFLGGYPQSPWGYLSTSHPVEAIGYQGLAYVGCPNYDLGSSASMPNFNFEIDGMAQNVPGKVDADPADVLWDFLTNVHYGAGFPLSRLGSFTEYSNYCRAAGLLISPVFSEASAANQSIRDILDLTNADAVWSEGELRIVPFGDVPLSANGAAYTPDLTPLFDLTEDDFLFEDGEDPVRLKSRTRPSDAYNRVCLEYLNRDNQYNPEPIRADDQEAIESYGLLPEDTKTAHFLCDGVAAQTAAQLWLQHNRVRNVYEFRLSWKYILLDPGDIVSITDAGLGLVKKPVRIREMSEDDTGKLTVAAIEIIPGTRSAEAYPTQAAQGYGSNTDIDPGSVNTPCIFEPPAKLVAEPQIWAAVSGGVNWGGCEVWVSADGSTYSRVGTIRGNARHGVLTAGFSSGGDPDTMNVLSVDLSEARGSLISGTQTDADAFATLCYVDGEYISYQTATLTSQYHYNLGTYLRRGANGSTIAAHASGTKFARLDGMIFKYTYTQNMIAKTISLKFLSFNLYGGHKQSLSDVSAYSITLAGTSVPAGYTYNPDYTPVYDYRDTGA